MSPENRSQDCNLDGWWLFRAVALMWRRWPPFLLSLPCSLSKKWPFASSVNVFKSESCPGETVGYVAQSRSPPDFFLTSACRGWMKIFFLSLSCLLPGLYSSLLSSRTLAPQCWGWSPHSLAQRTLSGSSHDFRARWTADMSCTSATRWPSASWRPTRWASFIALNEYIHELS